MDYEKIVHTICDPFLMNPESLMVRELPSESEKDVVLLICTEASDTARLIGKKGTVANALREVIAVAGKNEGKRIHLKFESFDDDHE